MGQRLDNAKGLYIEAIRDGNYAEAINRYAGDRYTQHSTPVRDGREGFVEFFADFVKRNPSRDIEIVRAFEDGQYVFLHVLQTLGNGEFQYATADIFDTDDAAKLIEHWDIISEVRSTTVSGRTQLDGPTEPTDLHQTAANKQLTAGLVNEVLITGDFERAGEFMATDFAQHNPDLGDGIGSLQAFAAQSSLRYIQLHHLIGSGNFVATLSESECNQKRHAVIDLYRIDDAFIVEHWDVIEEITPEDTWVNTGKF